MTKKVKKIKLTHEQKRAKYLARTLEGVLLIKNGLYTVGLTKQEIYTMITESKLILKDGELGWDITIEYEE